MFTDIDECETDNGNCQEQCNNTLGSYFCECGVGFALQPDERTCGGKAHAQLLSSQTTNHWQKLRANFSQRRSCVVAIIFSKINRSTVKRMDMKDKSIRRQVGAIMISVPVMTHSSLELRQLGRSHKTD